MRADRLPGLPLISQLPRRTARQTRALEKNNFVCVTCYPFLIVSGSEVSEAVSVVKLWFYVCVCVCVGEVGERIHACSLAQQCQPRSADLAEEQCEYACTPTHVFPLLS